MDQEEISIKNAQIRDSIISIGNNQINYYGKDSFKNIMYLPSMNIGPENAPTAFQEQDIYLVERTKEQKREVDKAYNQENVQNNVKKDNQDKDLEGHVYDIYKWRTNENGYYRKWNNHIYARIFANDRKNKPINVSNINLTTRKTI